MKQLCLAARKNKRLVTKEDFEEAKDKVLLGAERRSMVMTEEEKKLQHIMKQDMLLPLFIALSQIQYINQA